MPMTPRARNDAAETAELRVRVTPRGGKDAIMGVWVSDGTLLLRVSAVPEGGAANRACVPLIADALGVKKHQVALVSGHTSREKRFRIDTINQEFCRSILEKLPRVGGETEAEPGS